MSQEVVPAHFTWTDEAGDPKQLFFDLVRTEDYDFGADVTEHPVEKGPNVADHVRVKLDTATITIFATNEPIDSNNWTDIVQATVLLDQPTPKNGSPNPIIQYDDYDNFITERALATGAGGLAGGLTGSPLVSGAGAIGASLLSGALIPGTPVPKVFNATAGLAGDPPLPPIEAKILQPQDSDDFVQRTIQALRDLKDAGQVVDLIAPRVAVFSLVITNISPHRDADTGTGAAISVELKEIRVVATTTVPAPAPTVPRAKSTVSKGEQNTQPVKKQSAAFQTLHGAASNPTNP